MLAVVETYLRSQIKVILFFLPLYVWGTVRCQPCMLNYFVGSTISLSRMHSTLFCQMFFLMKITRRILYCVCWKPLCFSKYDFRPDDSQPVIYNMLKVYWLLFTIGYISLVYHLGISQLLYGKHCTLSIWTYLPTTYSFLPVRYVNECVNCPSM